MTTRRALRLASLASLLIAVLATAMSSPSTLPVVRGASPATPSAIIGPHSSYPPAPSTDATGLYTVTTVVSGVNLQVQANFLPSGFEAEPMGNAIQGALAASDNPLREFEVQAAGYGGELPLEGISGIAAGSADSVGAELVAGYVSAGGTVDPLAPPPAELFGMKVAGVSIIHTSRLQPGQAHTYVTVQWVTESMDRLWLVRVAQEVPASNGSFTANRSFIDGLSIDIEGIPSVSTAFSAVVTVPKAGEPSVLPMSWTNVSMPFWWNGSQCDSARTGSSAVFTAPNGLVACWPNPRIPATGFPVVQGAPQPTEFECVELANRWLYQEYGQPAYIANGGQMVSNYPGTRLLPVVNGTVGQSPQPGDVISFNNSSNQYGHTAVIYASNVDANGNGIVSEIEENSGTQAHEDFRDVSWSLQASGVLTPIAWLHDQNDDSQGATGPVIGYGSSFQLFGSG